MRPLTLRQIEMIRAVMVTGTINGAAALLNVAAPGVSRLIRYTEDSLGIRLFERKAGLFLPAPEAEAVFRQINQVYEQVENLGYAIESLRRGDKVELAFASVPSIAYAIAPRAVRGLRARFPDLFVNLNIVKIEEATDYLLLEQGEFVAMSYALDNPALTCQPLAVGEILAILPEDHALAGEEAIAVEQLAGETLIGVDPSDPYGKIVAEPFVQAGLEVRHSIRGRFAQTVIDMVRHGLGVALIDEFSVAERAMPGLRRVALKATAELTVYAIYKKGRALSSFAEIAIEQLRKELHTAIAERPWTTPSRDVEN